MEESFTNDPNPSASSLVPLTFLRLATPYSTGGHVRKPVFIPKCKCKTCVNIKKIIMYRESASPCSRPSEGRKHHLFSGPLISQTPWNRWHLTQVLKNR